jgi:hypothetical protein
MLHKIWRMIPGNANGIIHIWLSHDSKMQLETTGNSSCPETVN